MKATLLGWIVGASVAVIQAQPPTPYTFVTFAGSIEAGSADGPVEVARFKQPRGLALDDAGVMYVADPGNHTIRKITPAGEVTTLAGKAGVAGSADGAGALARFQLPAGLAVDKGDGVFVADFSNQTIRKVSAAGEVVTVAGLAETAGEANGTGAGARFNGPIAVVADGSGNLYVAEYWNHRIRKGWPAVAPVLGGRPVATGDGTLQLTVSGATGSRYVVQASSDLRDWVSLTNCTSTSATVTVAVPGPTDAAPRFYRAVLE
jgi:hypothetical protein